MIQPLKIYIYEYSMFEVIVMRKKDENNWEKNEIQIKRKRNLAQCMHRIEGKKKIQMNVKQVAS